MALHGHLSILIFRVYHCKIDRKDVESEALKIIDGIAGNAVLRKDSLIIAAGNTPDNSSLAHGLPAPTVNRLTVISVSPPSIEDWIQYMKEKGHDGELVSKTFAFLLSLKDNGELRMFESSPEPETLKPFPTPRSWERLLDTVQNKGFLSLTKSQQLEVMAGIIGEELAIKLSAFLETQVNLNELLKNPEMFSKLSHDGKYIVLYQIVSYIENNNNLDTLEKLFKEIEKTSKEFLIMIAMIISEKKLESYIMLLDKLGMTDYLNDILDVAKRAKGL